MTLGGVSRRAFWVFVSTFSTLTLGYAASVLIARALGPGERGLFAILQNDAIVATQVLAVGVHEAVLYYGSRRRRLQPALLGLALLQTLLLAIVTLGFVVLFGPSLARAQGGTYSAHLWLLAGSLVPLTYLECATLHLVQTELNFKVTNRMTVIARFTVLLSALVLVVQLGLGVTGAVLGLIAFEAVQIAVYLPLAARRGIGFSMRVARASLSYGVRIQFGALFRVASGRFDVLLLSFFVAHATVAYYAIAQIVSELVLLMPRALATVLLPVVASDRRANDLSTSTLRMNGTLSLIALLTVAACGPALILFGYGASYRPALLPFLILLGGIWFVSAGNLVTSVLSAHGRPGLGSFLVAFEGVLTVGLDVLLIPRFGTVGAAVASVISYAAFGLTSIAVLGKQNQVSPFSLLLMTPHEMRAAWRHLRTLVRRRLGAGEPKPETP